MFGSALFLPAAGTRSTDSSLSNRGTYGYYWSSRMDDSVYAYSMDFSSGGANCDDNSSRSFGFSVRCIAE